MKKLGIMLVGALVALLSLAPIAGAKSKHHNRSVKVCGIVDATSTLPTSLVLATGGTTRVTIANTNNVVLDAGIVVGADVCAKAKRVATPAAPAARHHKSTPKTLVLVSATVRPAASVEARGPVTLAADSATVATLVFTFPAGFVLSPKVTDGKVVKAVGFAALPDGVITLKKLKRVARHGHSRTFSGVSTKESAVITGRVSDLVPADATTAGSLKVGGIALVIPAGKVLRTSVADGAFVTAKAGVTTGALTLKKVHVLSRAVLPAV
jgi:hypothetical protein